MLLAVLFLKKKKTTFRYTVGRGTGRLSFNQAIFDLSKLIGNMKHKKRQE